VKAKRLDVALVERGLCESREKARRLILAGQVLRNGAVCDKASAPAGPDDDLQLKEKPRYVSRGGFKLEGALRHFSVDPTGLTCLDVGASTGGFTDCLLQHGAAKVHCLDVGTNQLVWSIRSDTRVHARENFNARHLTPSDLPEPVDFVVIDVSFISLALILPAVAGVLSPGGRVICLIKPQFELRREDVGRGGIVRDPVLHEQAVSKIRDFVDRHPDLHWLDVMESPIQGTDGNREFLALLEKPDRPVP
jgi:23S rRNA (cytidine1920-2'-O)/16S rRNA (cytidine1409-2'-O)-methyltransferase